MIELFNFIYQRQLIWHKRYVQKLPPPWTQDKILQTFKFCEVYREQDRGTKYLIEKIINSSMIVEDKIFNIIYYRRFNWAGFFEFTIPRHGRGFRMKDHEEDFDERIKNGFKLFNDAYTICQVPFDSSYRPKDKHIQVLMSMEEIGKNIGNLTQKLENSKSLKECHELLTNIKLIGPFLAYQILQDIQYIPNFLNHDINSFVHAGPGARPAIDLLYSGTGKDYEKRCELIFNSQEHYFQCLKLQFGKNWDEIYYPNAYYKNKYLSIGNIQSCLCEYRKFFNLSRGIGRRRYYKGD